MSEVTKTCKDCKLTKSEFDFGKGKGVCKACIAVKTKETKEAKANDEAKNKSPTKKEKAVDTEESAPPSKLSKKTKKLQLEFEKMLSEFTPDTPQSKVNSDTLIFIGKLILFSSKFNSE